MIFSVILISYWGRKLIDLISGRGSLPPYTEKSFLNLDELHQIWIVITLFR